MTARPAEWSARLDEECAGRVLRTAILRDGASLGYSDAIDLWQHDASFRRFFISLLADAPLPAYFWEMPPVTTASSGRAFEFVLVESRDLARLRPDPRPFESRFNRAHGDDEVLEFPNLGRDADLVVPCPRAPPAAYPHLAAFARRAPERQQHALWRAVGSALERRLREEPTWLSTAGLGVSWLHVRLDSFPKYYTYGPYREAT
ncbi:MAG: hypothetical protein OEQ13_02450 [Acidobacteriota bacterium]|nr:hypothetical protein [Acidobacteriota bacterium]